MPNQWVRLWVDMPTCPKFRTISRLSKQPLSAVISMFVFLMTDAANAKERGVTQANDEDVSSALDLDIEQVQAIRIAMQGRVLDGDRLTGWEQRQPIREDDSSLRTRAWRERKKADNAKERNVTQCDAPDTDTDTDTDKRKEQTSSLRSDVSPEPKNRSGKSIHETQGVISPKDNGTGPSAPAHREGDAIAVITLPLNTGNEFPVTQAMLDGWTPLYPAVDVLQELRGMRGWLMAERSRRKTDRGILRFVTAWLKRTQDAPPKSACSTTSRRVHGTETASDAARPRMNRAYG